MHKAFKEGDTQTGTAINDQLMPIHNALFTEASPQPVKYAASKLGLCQNEVRLPLVRASSEAQNAVDDAMEKVGLLSSGKSEPEQKAHG